jgi:hypothetical protein
MAVSPTGLPQSATPKLTPQKSQKQLAKEAKANEKAVATRVAQQKAEATRLDALRKQELREAEAKIKEGAKKREKEEKRRLKEEKERPKQNSITGMFRSSSSTALTGLGKMRMTITPGTSDVPPLPQTQTSQSPAPSAQSRVPGSSTVQQAALLTSQHPSPNQTLSPVSPATSIRNSVSPLAQSTGSKTKLGVFGTIKKRFSVGPGKSMSVLASSTAYQAPPPSSATRRLVPPSVPEKDEEVVVITAPYSSIPDGFATKNASPATGYQSNAVANRSSNALGSISDLANESGVVPLSSKSVDNLPPRGVSMSSASVSITGEHSRVGPSQQNPIPPAAHGPPSPSFRNLWRAESAQSPSSTPNGLELARSPSTPSNSGHSKRNLHGPRPMPNSSPSLTRSRPTSSVIDHGSSDLDGQGVPPIANIAPLSTTSTSGESSTSGFRGLESSSDERNQSESISPLTSQSSVATGGVGEGQLP